MTGPGTIWEVLGVAPTLDRAVIRRAYATRLRAVRPEDDSQGFMELRAAYEAALARAAQAELQASDGGVPAPAPMPAEPGIWVPVEPHARVIIRIEHAPKEPPPGLRPVEAAGEGTDAPEFFSPQSELGLIRALGALSWALRPDGQVADCELLTLLRQVLDLATRGSVMSQSDAERDLAQLLLDNAPRSDPLLEECVRRLEWDKNRHELATGSLLPAVLERLHDARVLVPLRSGKHPLADAFKRLRRPAPPLLRWWRAQVSQQGAWPELELLVLLQEEHPHLIRELHEAEVSWWLRFGAGPRISPLLLMIGYIIVLPLSAIFLLGALIAGAPAVYLAGVVLFPLAYAALTVAKLYVIDWPPHRVARRWPSLPGFVQAGWLPVMLAVCAATLLPRAPLLPAWAANLAGAAGCLWALYVSAPRALVMESRALQALVLNAALAIWVQLVATELAAPPWKIPAGAFAPAAWLMAASGLGLQGLHAAWLRLAVWQRKGCRLALAAGGGGLAWLLAAAPAASWQPLNAWLVLSFVIVHRVALDLRWRQVEARLVFLAACTVLARLALLVSGVDIAAPVTRAGGLVLVVAALFNLLATPGQPVRATRRKS